MRKTGTGKSTLVRFIVEALPFEEDDICYATYTGKAAEVLRKKGNKNAITLHKLLYETIPKADGTFLRRIKYVLPYKLIIVDECSMVPLDMVNQLLSYSHIYIIFLGDNFQLPPIDKTQDNHLLDNPHILLTEIMRQAEDSDIIQIATKIRMGETLKPFDGKDIKIYPKEALSIGPLKWADQIICATNKTRNKINQQMRAEYGKEGILQDGDKIICCKNYWDVVGSNDNPIINGTIGYVQNPYESFLSYPRMIYSDSVDIINAGFVSEEDEDFGRFIMDKKLFTSGERTFNNKLLYRLSKSKYKKLIPYEFEYAYSITCHRSQGSQWDNVLVLEEAFPFDKEEHARWLYTACTRSISKCVIFLK